MAWTDAARAAAAAIRKAHPKDTLTKKEGVNVLVSSKGKSYLAPLNTTGGRSFFGTGKGARGTPLRKELSIIQRLKHQKTSVGSTTAQGLHDSIARSFKASTSWKRIDSMVKKLK